LPLALICSLTGAAKRPTGIAILQKEARAVLGTQVSGGKVLFEVFAAGVFGGSKCRDISGHGGHFLRRWK